MQNKEIDLFLTNLDLEIQKNKQLLKKQEANSFQYKFLQKKIQQLIVVKKQALKKINQLKNQNAFI